MAVSNPIAPFLWGQGGAMLSPEQVARDREIAAALMGNSMDYSPVDHWMQGAARAAQGLVGGLKDRWADEAETAGRGGYRDRFANIFGGGGAADPVASALAASTNPAPAAGGDWLSYTNQGATRNLPISPELVSALSFLPEMGLSMEVFSGGQPSVEEGGGRVGSDRHDHGNAADVFFSQNGRRLDWANPQDLPLFEEIVRRGKAAGITGFGAGDGYMQPGSMHLGFGAPSVWGAGGRGSNAPDWLRSAYGAAETPAQVAQAGPDIASLLGLASDPWASETDRSIVMSLIGQQMDQQAQANDPLRQLQIQAAQQGLQRGDIEIQQLLNPAQEPLPYEVIDGQVVQIDPTAGTTRSLGNFSSPEETAAQQNYQFLLGQGVPPEQAMERAFSGGGTNVTVNNGGTDDFYKKMDTDLGAQQVALIEAGQVAQGNNMRLGQLEQHLANAPQGAQGALVQFAGSLGLPVDGASDVQAAQAIINQMVPGQRPPGSGTMSDADLALFKQSLPSILNQPGGNASIIQTTRAINEYLIKQAEIARRIANRELTPAEGRALQAGVPNPLAGFEAPAGDPAPGQSQAQRVTTEEQYNALPSGSVYMDPNGQIRTKR